MRKYTDMMNDLKVRNWYLAAISEIRSRNNPVINFALQKGWPPEIEYLQVHQYNETAIECKAAEWLELEGIEYMKELGIEEVK